MKEKDPVWAKNMSLRINSTAHVLHAFVNGEHIGSQWAQNGKFNYVFEQNVKFNLGVNQITLLSVTVGFQNYGAFFETAPAGITGPVEIVGRNGQQAVTKSLSGQKWSYKVGLSGFENKLYGSDSSSAWSEQSFPINRMMSWYKTTFKAPLGTGPIVVDLLGLGKGTAWINGNNIGRYWPSFLASEDGCAPTCDYRGLYSSEKCQSNCGKPTQRWYHVPRSFLNSNGNNTLVLFEEIGGNPSLVNFQTVTVGSVCAHAYEKNIVELSCNGNPISAIRFSSFGNPGGVCGSFEKGTCQGSNDAAAIIAKDCVGKEKCSIDVSEEKFGAADCGGVARRLAVEAVCQV